MGMSLGVYELDHKSSSTSDLITSTVTSIGENHRTVLI